TETTRVVLDLGHAEPFALRVQGSTVVVEVGPAHLAPPRTFARDRAPPTAASPPPVAVAAARPAPPTPHEIEGPPLPPRRAPEAHVPAPAKKPAAVAEAPRAPSMPLPVIVLDAG